MISIYRVEHRESRVGLFETRDPYTQALARKACKIRYLKAPGDDGLHLVGLPKSYVFGSSSIPALKRWVFLGDSFKANEQIIQKLHELGFALAEFLVEEGGYRESATKLQAAFDADTCRQKGLVEYRNLAELLVAPPLIYNIYALGLD